MSEVWADGWLSGARRVGSPRGPPAEVPPSTLRCLARYFSHRNSLHSWNSSAEDHHVYYTPIVAILRGFLSFLATDH